MLTHLVFLFLVIAYADYVPSKLTSSGCGAHCSQCWQIAGAVTDIICAECETGYFFDINYISGIATNNTICKSPADFDKGKLIIGFKRACANCGLHNYLDKDFNCKPCPLGCDACSSRSDGFCDACYKGPGAFDNYDINSGSCTCTQGKAEIVDGFCHCNTPDAYINKTTYECINCTKCTRDQAKCKTSTLSKIPPHNFDDDDKDCPQKCHISCDECHGPASTDCNRTSGGLLMCRNDLLWEEVKVTSGSTPLNECFCVCNAKIDYSESDPKCACELPKVKCDTCSVNYLKYHAKADCSESEKMGRNQCICPPGYANGARNASGAIQCVLRKYVAVRAWTISGLFSVFIDDAYYSSDGYMKPINNGFFGIWPSGIDALVYVPDNTYWAFKGNQTILYIKSDSNNGTVASGYPKNISDVWKGNSNLTFVDAAIHDRGNNRMYLVQGNTAYVYSMGYLSFERKATVESLFPNIPYPFNFPDSVMAFSNTEWKFVKGTLYQHYLNNNYDGAPEKMIENMFGGVLPPLNFTY